MNAITSMTPQQLRKAADLQEKILTLQRQLSSLVGGSAAVPAAPAPAKKKGKISAAGLARIRAAQKARWAKAKSGAAKAAPAAARKSRPKLSAAGRARLKALAKARWAKAKAAGKSRL